MAAEAAAVAPPAPTEEPATAAPVKAPELKAVADTAKAAKAEKGKKEKKKGKQASAPAEEGDGAPSIAAHPRAARAVARAKGWGGLGGFLIGGYLSLPTATLLDAGLRALAAGVICYVVAWAGAVFAWRRLVIIEIKAREQRLLTAVQAASGRAEPAGPTRGESGGGRAAS